jgi:CHASE1-domain containing sensor protein
MKFGIRLKTYITMPDGKTPTRPWKPWGHQAIYSSQNKKGQYVISYIVPLNYVASWIFKNLRIKI